MPSIDTDGDGEDAYEEEDGDIPSRKIMGGEGEDSAGGTSDEVSGLEVHLCRGWGHGYEE